jgi:hypothetical protein
MAWVRSTLIKVFAGRHGHNPLPFSLVVPHDDPTPTLLFMNAGMNQYKPLFLEMCDPALTIARLSRGKHRRSVSQLGGVPTNHPGEVLPRPSTTEASPASSSVVFGHGEGHGKHDFAYGTWDKAFDITVDGMGFFVNGTLVMCHVQQQGGFYAGGLAGEGRAIGHGVPQ